METVALAVIIIVTCTCMHRLIWLYRNHRAQRLSEAELHPRPFLRPALNLAKAMDRVFGDALAAKLDEMADRHRPPSVAKRREHRRLDEVAFRWKTDPPGKLIVGDLVPYEEEMERVAHEVYNRHLLADPAYQADVVLYLADPRFAVELGFEAPRCERCGGEILRPPSNWNGVTELVHLIPAACDWEREEPPEPIPLVQGADRTLGTGES